MGLVNTVVPLAELEATTIQWCREMLAQSPTALRFLKAALNADCDGQAGLQELAGNATLLYYMTEEGREGKEAFLEKRTPDFSKFPRLPMSARPALGTWLAAARPRTLPAAVVPVVVGTARARARAAASRGARRSPRSPARSRSRSAPTSRTTCSTPRRAPTAPTGSARLRAVSAGLISAAAMKRAMIAAFAVARAFGALPRRGRAAGRSSRSASPRSPPGIAYTGGPWPLGYHGLGDVFVMVFFGFVAVCGTAFVQLGRVPALAVVGGGPGRRARDRDPRRQQPARPRDRRARRQAHARGAARPARARSSSTRCCSRSPTLVPVALAVARGRGCALPRRRPRRSRLRRLRAARRGQRRPGAQPAARRDRAAAARCTASLFAVGLSGRDARSSRVAHRIVRWPIDAARRGARSARARGRDRRRAHRRRRDRARRGRAAARHVDRHARRCGRARSTALAARAAGSRSTTPGHATALAARITAAPRRAVRDRDARCWRPIAQQTRTSVARLLSHRAPRRSCGRRRRRRRAARGGRRVAASRSRSGRRLARVAIARGGARARGCASTRTARGRGRGHRADARALADLPIDFVEEPCADAHELLDRPLPCRIALDESLIELAPAELARALESPQLAALVLKPTLLGGFSRCLELAARGAPPRRRADRLARARGPDRLRRVHRARARDRRRRSGRPRPAPRAGGSLPMKAAGASSPRPSARPCARSRPRSPSRARSPCSTRACRRRSWRASAPSSRPPSSRPGDARRAVHVRARPVRPRGIVHTRAARSLAAARASELRPRLARRRPLARSACRSRTPAGCRSSCAASPPASRSCSTRATSPPPAVAARIARTASRSRRSCRPSSPRCSTTRAGARPATCVPCCSAAPPRPPRSSRPRSPAACRCHQTYGLTETFGQVATACEPGGPLVPLAGVTIASRLAAARARPDARALLPRRRTDRARARHRRSRLGRRAASCASAAAPTT